jgi:hypothetical protein
LDAGWHYGDISHGYDHVIRVLTKILRREGKASRPGGNPVVPGEAATGAPA